MSMLVPSVLPLDKGLDLQTAKIIAQPGTVLDTLNYEQVDFQGQKRIEGYTRYDGSVLSAIDEYYVLVVNDVSPAVTAGDLLLKDNMVFGVIAETSGGAIYYLRTNAAVEVLENNSIDVVFPVGPGNSYTVVSNTPGKEVTPTITPEAHYAKLLSLMELIRQRVEALPGGIIGLHWFRDRLYSVADTAYIQLGSTPEIYPNDVLTINGVNYPVLDVYVTPAVQTILLGATDVDFVGQSVTRGIEDVGIAQVDTYDVTLPRVATIFESRTEQQVLDEPIVGAADFGWRSKHLGWMVNYEKGKVLYGSLASLNQNRQNVGIEGPTDTSGINGSPAVLFQKIALTNGPAQVNGWKSTDTPTNYVLDATDVQQIDSKFTYADAFVSWTADSSVVTTPGSDMITLTEYSPTNKIVYTALPP